MSELSEAAQLKAKNGEVDYEYLFTQVWKAKFQILLVTALFTLFGILWALSQPNIYRAQALLAPSEENSGGGLSAMANEFGGLASLAGLNLGKGSVDKSTMALEVLQSRAFITEFINKRNLDIYLFAAKDFKDDELVIDESIYDVTSKTWNESVLLPGMTKPTDWDLFNSFIDVLKVSQDKTTGLVTISVDYYSAKVAKNWVDWLIVDLNEHIRNTDVAEAKTSVAFLEEQLKQTSVSDMHSMFYKLIEKQYQTIMLANVREQYMFKVLDPAVVPQDKIAPKRALIACLSMVIGFLLSTFAIVILASVRRH